MGKNTKSSLRTYRQKRDFSRTGEPSGLMRARKASRAVRVRPAPARTQASAHRRIFVVQAHDARRLHWDFRLEVEGVLVSWAVPKEPSMDPADKRLAVRTEDHPLEYAAFEGNIPEGNYGAGGVIVWDGGVYENLKYDADGNEVPMAQAIEDGHLTVRLEGRKLRGAFALTRTSAAQGKENWIFVKMRDEYAGAEIAGERQRERSILSGRSLEEVENQTEEVRAGRS